MGCLLHPDLDPISKSSLSGVQPDFSQSDRIRLFLSVNFRNFSTFPVVLWLSEVVGLGISGWRIVFLYDPWLLGREGGCMSRFWGRSDLRICPVGCCLICLVWLIQQIDRRSKMSWDGVINLCGLLLFALFLSITLSTMSPFQCQQKPNGSRSMATWRGPIP